MELGRRHRAQSPRDLEDGRLPAELQGPWPPSGRPQAAGRAKARQLGDFRGPQGSEPSLNKAGFYGAFSHFLF